MPQFTTAIVERLRIQQQTAGHAQHALLVRQQPQLQRCIAMHLQCGIIIAQIAAGLQRNHSQTTATFVETVAYSQ